MNLEVNYLVNNDCYKQNKKIIPAGIVVHSVGCAQPNRQVFVKNWNVSGIEKCVNAFVDDSGITQTLPWDTRPWGCGKGSKGSYNNSHIQFEMCEPAGSKYKGGQFTEYNVEKNADFFNKCYNNAVELCVFLCQKYHLSSDSIVCHSEAYKLGYGSNHSDVMHWFPKHGKNMDIFREDVRKLLNSGGNNSTSEDKNDSSDKNELASTFKAGDLVRLDDYAVQYDGKLIRSDYMNKEYKIKEIKNDRAVLTIDSIVIYAVSTKYLKHIGYEDNASDDFKPYLVKVTTSSLNIRSGPGVSFSVLGNITDYGVYTIVEQEGTWGKLKSGAGWISLNYTRKL